MQEEQEGSRERVGQGSWGTAGEVSSRQSCHEARQQGREAGPLHLVVAAAGGLAGARPEGTLNRTRLEQVEVGDGSGPPRPTVKFSRIVEPV